MIIETAIIISFSAWLGSKIADKGFDSIYSKLTSESGFDKTFHKCIKKVANKLEEKYPDILGKSINYFFTQEDVFDELCKLLFVNQEVSIEIISETFHEALLPSEFMYEFVTELKATLASEPEYQELLANKELFIAVKGISKDLDELVLNSSMTFDEIKNIKEMLQERFKSKFNLDSFLTLYNKNLVNNLATLNFIGLGIDPSIKKGKRKEIEKIFVKPFFKLRSKYHIENETENKISYYAESDEFDEDKFIPYNHLFDRPYNFIILGNPGSGKSLLIKSIVCSIARNNTKHFHNKRITSYIPFRIELKNYLAYKKERGSSLLKYLAYSLEEEYSVPSILEDNLSNVFKTEKAIVFFDGLDEIFNATDKIQIKNDIENFHNLFPKIRSITTSRFIGYNEAKLDEKRFCELSIKSFNNSQIQEYTNKWYSLEEEDIEVRNSEVGGFISKMNTIDNELLSNPLLLSLIVILYRNNLKIPESKLEIYQSCTNTLVDKWDEIKNLEIKLDSAILLKKEPIFSDLAFWQYELLSSKNTKTTYHMAKETVAKSLIKKKVADEYNCGKLSELFLNYAQKRSIYFDNNFTHKTFLEYYSAYWIYSNVEKKHNVNERNRILRKYISIPFWFIVLELLLNMIDKDQPDTEIIDSIFSEQNKNNKSLQFLVYIMPNINNISNEVTIETYKKAILYLISVNKIDQKRKDLFNRILKNTYVTDHIDRFKEALLSIELKDRNLNFYILINEMVFSPRLSEIKLDISDILDTEHYKISIKSNPYLFQIDYSYNRSIILDQNLVMERISNFIQLFGNQELFKINHSYYDTYGLSPFIGYYFYSQLDEKNIDTILQNLSLLKEKSISIFSLIKYVARGSFYSFTKIKSLNYLCSLIEKKSASDEEKLFFVILLKEALSNIFVHRREDKIVVKDLSASTKLKSLLRKTAKQNLDRSVDIIISDLGLTDKEIMSLVPNIKKLVDSKYSGFAN